MTGNEISPIDRWVEWKEKCALNLCSDETRVFLGRQAEKKLAGYLFSVSDGRLNWVHSEKHNIDSPFDKDESVLDLKGEKVNLEFDCENSLTEKKDRKNKPQTLKTFYRAWHLFEDHCYMKSNEVLNKNYKDYIFYRASIAPAEPMKVINGLFKDMMRDVTREYVRNNYSLKYTSSMSEPISTSDKISKKTTVEDKLGNNDSRIEIFDSVNAAKKAAIQILKDLDRISKIILISSYAKISLDDMDVKIFTGLKRDALYRRIKILKENIKSQIKTLLKINSQEELADMNKFVINFLASEIFVEFSSEKPMESFLNRIEIKTEETF